MSRDRASRYLEFNYLGDHALVEMNMNLKTLLFSAVASASRSACRLGGGNDGAGGSSSIAPNADPRGLWRSQTSDGSQVITLVLETGQCFSVNLSCTRASGIYEGILAAKVALIAAIGAASVLLAGCETTNSIPYKASAANVIAIQQSLQSKKVSVGDIGMAPGVDESPLCRMLGPVKVAPGKTPSQYIKDAFQEELLMAQAYDIKGPPIEGRIEELSFSSVSPAYWQIALAVMSPVDKGYKVSVKYLFDTSFSAMGACKNVADAFGPAVQELLKQVVANPQFPALSGK